MKLTVLLIFILQIACGVPATNSDLKMTLNDTIVISKKITNEISGSAYRKKATQYQLINSFDTSKFSIIISESNSNEFDHAGSVYLELNFDKDKSFRQQKQELKVLLANASKEYKLDSLKSIYSIWTPTLGDLDLKVSKELESRKDIKKIQNNYWRLNDFLLNSSLSLEINDIFSQYKLTVKQYSIEHLSYYSKLEILKEYSKIETKPIDFQMEIIAGQMTIYFN